LPFVVDEKLNRWRKQAELRYGPCYAGAEEGHGQEDRRGEGHRRRLQGFARIPP
jgi:hypothetical protein